MRAPQQYDAVPPARKTSTIVLPALASLALLSGCLPDPKSDPCHDLGAISSLCDDASEDESQDGDGDVRDPVLDAGTTPDSDGGVTPDMDAATAPDASLAPDAGGDGAPDEIDAGEPDAGPPRDPLTLELSGDLGVHDPAIISVDGAYVVFSTGAGIRVKRSADLRSWQDDGRVFTTNPSWIASQVPGATDLWAPDIARFGGKYHLYYSASTFGSRNSCIGHATATDLTSLDFEDQGPVVCTEESDDYNAIDPAFVVDADGKPWLSFGSFWSGIKLIPLDADGEREGTAMHALASRDNVQAIEAPYLLRRGRYYYLFVSFDLCCRGTASTYRIMVGRSESVTGPYADADGKPMLAEGGGSTVVLGDARWRGPGHNAVLTDGANQYLVYHAYDAEDRGAATLRISDLVWGQDGWPVQVGP